jgi:hypothetical protein
MGLAIQHAKRLSFKNCYQNLLGQEYKHIPIHLSNAVASGVSRTAALLYEHILHFYNLQLAAGKSDGVCVTIEKLSSLVERSSRHTSRCLSELVNSGFLLRVSNWQCPNTYFPLIPENVQHELIDKPKRKSKQPTNDKLYFKGAAFGATETSDVTGSSVGVELLATTDVAVATKQQEVYAQYSNQVKKLETVLGPLKANLQAFNALTLEEKTIYHQFVEQMKVSTSAQAALPVSLSRTKMSSINNIYNIVNNSTAFDNFPKQQNYPPTQTVVVNLNEKITPEYIEKSIRKFIERNLLSELAFNNKTLAELVAEAQFHVANRSNKTKTALHALNSFKSLLKSGKWSTPRKLVWQKTHESIERERAWKAQKKQEGMDVIEFIQELNKRNLRMVVTNN